MQMRMHGYLGGLGLGAGAGAGAGAGVLLSATQQRFWLHFLATDAMLLNAELLLLLPLALELLQVRVS